MLTAAIGRQKLRLGIGLVGVAAIGILTPELAFAFSPLPPNLSTTLPIEPLTCADGAWATIEDDPNKVVVHRSACSIRPGDSQANPVLPDVIRDDRFIFRGVRSGQWFDPPMTPGYRYEMLSGSLFTQLLNLPVGIDSDETFAVSVGNLLLGEFRSNQTVDFVSLLGSGVPEFTIAGIDPLVNSQDPIAFPVRLGFNTDTADFSMQPVSSAAAVPEPSSMIGLLVAGASGLGLRRRRKKLADGAAQSNQP